MYIDVVCTTALHVSWSGTWITSTISFIIGLIYVVGTELQRNSTHHTCIMPMPSIYCQSDTSDPSTNDACWRHFSQPVGSRDSALNYAIQYILAFECLQCVTFKQFIQLFYRSAMLCGRTYMYDWNIQHTSLPYIKCLYLMSFYILHGRYLFSSACQLQDE